MKTATTCFVRLLILSIFAFQTLSIRASGSAPLAFALPDAKAGDAYEFTIGTQGGLPPFKWCVIEGNLPPGIELQPGGTLRGTPNSARTQAHEFCATGVGFIRAASNVWSEVRNAVSATVSEPPCQA